MSSEVPVAYRRNAWRRDLAALFGTLLVLGWVPGQLMTLVHGEEWVRMLPALAREEVSADGLA